MTWHLDPDTGDLYNPDGTIETTLTGPPWTIPDDVQAYVDNQLRETSLATITTDQLADYLQAYGGNVEFGVP